MSTHNICFCGEIRKNINNWLKKKKSSLYGTMPVLSCLIYTLSTLNIWILEFHTSSLNKSIVQPVVTKNDKVECILTVYGTSVYQAFFIAPSFSLSLFQHLDMTE